MHSLFKKTLLLLAIVSLGVSHAEAALLTGSKDSRVPQRAIAASHADDPWLLTYYVGYQNGYLKPKDVDYSLMTHIVVGGVRVREDGSLDEHWHLQNGDGRAMALDVGKRAKRAGVQTLIWLGGPNEEDRLFAATADSVRAKTVRNILELVDELDYDGVDINWEPIRESDKPRLLALVKDLRLARPNLLITVPVNWVQTTLLLKKDLTYYADLATYADRLFIMSYSMAGPWPGWKVWHGGALDGDTATTPGSVKTSVSAYLRAGVPKEKLGAGVGTYATCWEHPVRSVRGTIPSTITSKNLHTMSMATLMDGYWSSAFEKWDSKAQVPYLSFRKPRGDFDCGFISYENERSVAAKARYVRDEALGGLLVWNIGTGYMEGASRSKRHPLLKAAHETLVR